jgi:hypothetical protein
MWRLVIERNGISGVAKMTAIAVASYSNGGESVMAYSSINNENVPVKASLK